MIRIESHKKFYLYSIIPFTIYSKSYHIALLVVSKLFWGKQMMTFSVKSGLFLSKISGKRVFCWVEMYFFRVKIGLFWTKDGLFRVKMTYFYVFVFRKTHLIRLKIKGFRIKIFSSLNYVTLSMKFGKIFSRKYLFFRNKVCDLRQLYDMKR